MTRTRWQGWTLVDEDGNFSLWIDGDVKTPIVYPSKAQANNDKMRGEKVVRCELRIIIK